MVLTKFNEITERAGCASGNNWLDIGGDLDRDAAAGICYRIVYHCGIEPIVRILRDQLPWQRYASPSVSSLPL